MIINHNMNAMNAHRNMTANTATAGKAMEKLSSGLRINRAGDDAAGLSISEKMRGQIRGLDQATRNAQDGISMIQTAEGGLNETHAILQRMRELSVQASNDTNVDADRTAIATEIGQLTEEIQRISDTTAFNGKKLLDSSAGTVTFQVGANEAEKMDCAFDTSGIDLSAGVLSALGASGANVKVDTSANAQASITIIDKQIELVSTGRSTLGAWQNRLEHTINNLSNSSENLQSAESRIRDVDMAKEMMNYSKTNILTQAAQAMISQANQTPQGVLQLLR